MDLGATDFIGALHHEQADIAHGFDNLRRQRPCVFRGGFVAFDNRRDTLDTAEQRLQQRTAIAWQWCCGSLDALGGLCHRMTLINWSGSLTLHAGSLAYAGMPCPKVR